MKIISVAFILIVAIQSHASDFPMTYNKWIRALENANGHPFSYNLNSLNGPLHWYLIAADCKGNTQSPINIEKMNTVKKNASLIMTYFNQPVSAVHIHNNGHSLGVSFDFESCYRYICWSENKQSYIFDSAHIHWGPEGGSEHLVDNLRYAAELHLVHYNKKYANVSDALQYVDGLLVVGVFFEKSIQDGNFNKFIKFAKYVTQPSSSYSITNLAEIFNIEDLIHYPVTQYYGYKGSLTTPPCSQSVQWIVAEKPIKISASELLALKELQGTVDHDLDENYRPIQPLNGRSVHRYNF